MISSKIILLSTYFLFLSFLIDINECDNENAGCKHECVNTTGSYYCNCSEGYDLDEDNHNCLGM